MFSAHDNVRLAESKRSFFTGRYSFRSRLHQNDKPIELVCAGISLEKRMLEDFLSNCYRSNQSQFFAFSRFIIFIRLGARKIEVFFSFTVYPIE